MGLSVLACSAALRCHNAAELGGDGARGRHTHASFLTSPQPFSHLYLCEPAATQPVGAENYTSLTALANQMGLPHRSGSGVKSLIIPGTAEEEWQRPSLARATLPLQKTKQRGFLNMCAAFVYLYSSMYANLDKYMICPRQ